jgi:hypothetical protein
MKTRHQVDWRHNLTSAVADASDAARCRSVVVTDAASAMPIAPDRFRGKTLHRFDHQGHEINGRACWQ